MARRVSIALAALFIVAGAYSISTPATPDGNRGWNVAGFEWNGNRGWNVAGFEWTSHNPVN